MNDHEAREVIEFLQCMETRINQKIKALGEIMGAVNMTIAKLAADFQTFKTGANQYFADSTTFHTALKPFLQNVSDFIASIKASGTKLSDADQALVDGMDTQLQALTPQAAQLDADTQALGTQMSGITVPDTAAAPSGTTGTTGGTGAPA